MSKLARVLKIALIDYWRNRGVNFTSVIIIILVNITIAFFILLGMNFESAIREIEAKADVSFFLRDNATSEQVAALIQTLSNHPQVEGDPVYISKDDALEIFRRRGTGIEIDPADNPLPASIEVKATKPEYLEDVVSSVENSEIVESNGVKFNKAAIDKITYWAYLLRRIGMGLVIILIVVCCLVVINAIRLVIFSRRKEIEIMKLVGATDWFVSWPFIFESIYSGILGSLIAVGVFVSTASFINRQFACILKITLINLDWSFYLSFVFFQLLVGLLIGAVSGYIGVKKHLRV